MEHPPNPQPQLSSQLTASANPKATNLRAGTFKVDPLALGPASRQMNSEQTEEPPTKLVVSLPQTASSGDGSLCRNRSSSSD